MSEITLKHRSYCIKVSTKTKWANVATTYQAGLCMSNMCLLLIHIRLREPRISRMKAQMRVDRKTSWMRVGRRGGPWNFFIFTLFVECFYLCKKLKNDLEVSPHVVGERGSGGDNSTGLVGGLSCCWLCSLLCGVRWNGLNSRRKLLLQSENIHMEIVMINVLRL